MWSYTQSSGERYQADGSFYARWWNSWSVTELSPVTAYKIRLEVRLATQGFSKNGGYVWYCTDSLSCGGSSVTVRSYTVGADSGYTTTVEVPESWSGRSVTLRIGWCSVTVTLQATAAIPSSVTAEDGEFGRAVPVTITPALAGVRHRLRVNCAGRTEALLSENENALTLTWTPDLALYAALLPASPTAEAVFTCETVYDGNSMGSETRTVTLRFEPGSLAPALSPGWAAASVYNAGAAAGLTAWVQGYSRAEIAFDETKIACRYGASVASYSLRCEGETVSASPWRTPILPETAAELVCTVTDTRGQSASEALTVALCPYAPPVLQGVSIAHSEADGTQSEDGAYLAVLASALISSLDGENSAALSLRARPLSGDFGGATALTPGVRTVLPGFSPDVSWELELTLTDALANSARQRHTLPTRRWAMKFRPDGNGVAFGKAAETAGALELAPGWALILRGPNGETARLDYAALTALINN